MATYEELSALAMDMVDQRYNHPVYAKVAVAMAIAAENIRLEPPATPNHAERLAWAKAMLRTPAHMADSLMWVLLAQYSGNSIAQITAASDAAVQTAVDNALNLML